jgi:hypothetical protein
LFVFQREALGVLDGFQSQIDIEVGPVEMSGAGLFYIED